MNEANLSSTQTSYSTGMKQAPCILNRFLEVTWDTKESSWRDDRGTAVGTNIQTIVNLDPQFPFCPLGVHWVSVMMVAFEVNSKGWSLLKDYSKDSRTTQGWTQGLLHSVAALPKITVLQCYVIKS